MELAVPPTMTNTRLKSTEIAGYIVRSATGGILVETGDFLPESMIGVGQRCAKVYKTERAARKFNAHQAPLTLSAVNAHGIEIEWIRAQGWAS